ncbi:hypothetical protein SAMN06266982_11832 [Propioniciclava tarda]|nr:hypothetical protein SAMN06266982_11832 [Propioniciclava tarda]
MSWTSLGRAPFEADPLDRLPVDRGSSSWHLVRSGRRIASIRHSRAASRGSTMTDTNAESEKPKGPDKASRTDPRRRPPLNLTNGWLVAALVLWLLAAYAGTVAEALPREVIYTTRDGQGIGYCQDYFREAVARGDASNYEYCSTDTVFGRRLPEGHQSHVGAIQLGSIKPADFLVAALKPDLWLTVGVGGVAMILLFVFARATGTLRGGLAVSIALSFSASCYSRQQSPLASPATCVRNSSRRFSGSLSSTSVPRPPSRRGRSHIGTGPTSRATCPTTSHRSTRRTDPLTCSGHSLQGTA